MKFSQRGIPILTLPQKLASLKTCLATMAYEDAAGHLCDMLEFCRQRIDPSARPPFSTLADMVDRYGSDPTPVDAEAGC